MYIGSSGEIWKHREPIVYIKTVLMFGDKPAPAMVQIALRIDKAILCYEEKHPVLLPNEHRISLTPWSSNHNC